MFVNFLYFLVVFLSESVLDYLVVRLGYMGRLNRRGNPKDAGMSSGDLD